jgi:putative transposase
MHFLYLQKDIHKLFKKSIKNEIADNLPIEIASNADYTKREITGTILFAISNNISIEYASKFLRKKKIHSPSGDTIFYHLRKLEKNDVMKLFGHVNNTLLSHARRFGILDGRIKGAIDIHKIPYYGKIRDENLLGMENVRGTRFGHGYASIECTDDGKRFTFSVYPLNQFSTKREFITHLVDCTRRKANISCLFLDRGFFNFESIESLISLNVDFVIPVIRNRRISKIIQDFEERCKKIPYRERFVSVKRYEMMRGKGSLKVNLVIIAEKPSKLDERWYTFAYVTNIDVTYDDAFQLAEDYRKRWGIETGYRIKEKVRVKTCSRNYVVRLFFQLLSIILYNLWQLCNLVISVKIRWNKRFYPIILDEFKSILSDFIISG